MYYQKIKSSLFILLGVIAVALGASTALLVSAPAAYAGPREDHCYSLYESTLATCDSIAARGEDPAPCYHAALGNLQACLRG